MEERSYWMMLLIWLLGKKMHGLQDWARSHFFTSVPSPPILVQWKCVSMFFLLALLQCHVQFSVDIQWRAALNQLAWRTVLRLMSCSCLFPMLAFNCFILQTKSKRWRMLRRPRLSIWRSPQSSHAHQVAVWWHRLIWMYDKQASLTQKRNHFSISDCSWFWRNPLFHQVGFSSSL